MKIKKIVLGLGLIGTAIAYTLFHSRGTGLCNIYCGEGIDQYQNIFLLFPFVLLFSILTYKMTDSIFSIWWKFARIAIPVILIISTLINLQLHHTPGGFMNLDNLFDIPAQIFMYVIFIAGSIVQIVRGYRNR